MLVEQSHDLALLLAGVCRQWLGFVRPTGRRPEQPGGKGLPRIQVLEETQIDRFPELPAKDCIDVGVECDVVGLGRTGKQTSVPQDDVIELVKNKHEQMLVTTAMALDKVRVDVKAGLRAR